MRKFLSTFAFAVAIFGTAVCLQAQRKTEVIVLATLHQYHATVKGYSFADLSKIIERAKPDILAVELTPSALRERTEQRTKQEYPKSIFPLIDKHRYQAVPLEPPDPLYSELVGLLKESSKDLQDNFPQKAEAFSLYSDSLYKYLFKIWDSPAAVNSGETDGQFEVKHAYQNALFGEREEKVWNGWNTHFLEQIVKTAHQKKGKRIVVTVGVEHAYWLRNHLRAESDIAYVNIDSILGRHPHR